MCTLKRDEYIFAHPLTYRKTFRFSFLQQLPANLPYCKTGPERARELLQLFYHLPRRHRHNI